MDKPTEYAVWCDWHQGPCRTGVLIDIIERASAPSVSRYACRSCRGAFDLTPYKETQALGGRL